METMNPIRELRKRANLSQCAFAATLCVPVFVIQQSEYAKTLSIPMRLTEALRDRLHLADEQIETMKRQHRQFVIGHSEDSLQSLQRAALEVYNVVE